MSIHRDAQKISKIRYSILLSICFVVVHAYLLWDKGVREFYDSVLYIKSADYFIAQGKLGDNYLIFYFIPIAMIGFFKSIFDDGLLWFVLFQIAVYGIAMICMFKASSKLFKTRAAGIITVVIMLLWVENVRWNTAVMTESIFCSLVCLVWYLTTIFSGGRWHFSVLLLALVAVPFCRPTGVVVILGVLVFMIMRYRSILTRYWLVMATTSITLLFVVGWVAYVMFSNWDFTEQFQKGNIITYADVVEGSPLELQGMRYDSDGLKLPAPNLHPMEKMIAFIWYNPIVFLKSFGVKVFYLLSGTRPYYSVGHNLFSLVWLGLLYITACFGFMSMRNRSVAIAICAVVVFNCILIGMSTVDWDNRFYIPMAPGIALLAGGGVIEVIKRVLDILSESDSTLKSLNA